MTLANKKILLLNNQGLNESGGGVSMIESLVFHLSERNAVTLISEGEADSEFDGRFRNVKFMPKRYAVLPVLWRFAPLLSSFALQKPLKSLVSGYDIVIALDCRYAFALWKYYRRSLRVYISLSAIPLVAYHDCLTRSHRALVFLQYCLMERAAFQRAHLSFTSSRVHLAEVRKYERIRVNPVVAHPFLASRSAANRDAAAQAELKRALGAEGKTLIVTVSRVTRLKNIVYLVTLAEQLQRDDVLFAVVGDGADYHKIARLIQEKGLGGKIALHGRHENPKQFYQAADIYLHPSRYESFCCTIYEAMLSGLPVIFPKNASGYVSAFEELIQPDDALCVDFGNPANVRDALLRLIDDAPFRRQIGANALRRAAAFSTDFPPYAEEVERRIAEALQTHQSLFSR